MTSDPMTSDDLTLTPDMYVGAPVAELQPGSVTVPRGEATSVLCTVTGAVSAVLLNVSAGQPGQW